MQGVFQTFRVGMGKYTIILERYLWRFALLAVFGCDVLWVNTQTSDVRPSSHTGRTFSTFYFISRIRRRGNTRF